MTKIDVAVCAPHPDDAELFCGGVLLKLKKQGYRTAIADMTRGELGTRGSAEQRAREAQKASAILQVDQRVNLNIDDGRVTVNEANKEKVIRLLRDWRPAIILAPFHEDRHPDHVHTSRLISEAVFFSGLPKWDTGQPPWRPRQIIYYFMHHQEKPSFIVDISDEFAQKMEAVRAYGSQFHNPDSKEPATYISDPAFLKNVETRAAWYGFQIGVEYGEPFFVKSPVRVNNLLKQFT
ncbi:MAG: bacillithiol biosynthesis deacetylase BshB1 [Calditrichaeota bacterium]|nr:MAG: bacillithiol biosynthesis deacetylase BshB1 [Calditrichota bacterium]